MSAFLDAHVRGTRGMEAISTGTCPGCETCMDIDRHTDADKHRRDWRTQDMPSNETSFSWRPCGICGTTLGGDRSAWHWIDPNDPKREINHESDACTDCVVFLANGDEPEQWSAR